MSPPRVRRPGIALVAFAVVAAATLLSAGLAHADVPFRKASADATGAATAGRTPASGGGTVLAAADPPVEDSESPPDDSDQAAPPPKTEYVPQAEDKDRPTDPALLDQQRTDAQLAAQAKAKGAPFYTKWQFWAITGGVIVGLVAAIWGGAKIVHAVGGGDVRPCGMDFNSQCYGEGRSQ